MLDEIYERIAMKVEDDFTKFCQDNNISIDLRVKRKNDLSRKKEFFKKKCLNYCNNQIVIFIEEKAKDVGDFTLNDTINRLMRVKDSYQLDEANQKFEIAWADVQANVQSVLKTEDIVINETHNLVSSSFRDNTLSQQR